MKHFSLNTILSLMLFLNMCQSTIDTREAITNVPEWAKDAIWYQIFPERFRNGDPGNDPTIETLKGTWPYEPQSAWQLMPWTSDWYELQPWEKANQRGFYYNAQLRRYGGDLQGILDELDYLQELGIDAIYLNPVFESASSHKYGATMYHHIDNNFGPDPLGDIAIWSREDPADPGTWQWTSADLLFLQLVREVHARNMYLIIDGVFNHVGILFWAFQDVREKGPASPFTDWFVIQNFDDPGTPEDEFQYQGWFNFTDLPEIQEDEHGADDSFREHIHQIVKRWMDPNGDGDPSDGVDGWRLDVAETVSPDFWRDFRRWTREINPVAFLSGEVWWRDFPRNIMFDAAPWLRGDMFDAVMNYRFADAMLKAFVDQANPITPSQLDLLLGDIRIQYPQGSQYGLMNLMASHDTERFASMVANPDRWIDHASNLNYDKNFDVNKPSPEERQVQKLILAFQFTYIGAPYIFYGDEVGMWGADDPDCRKPMLWLDLLYKDEICHPFDLPKEPDGIEPDMELFRFYQQMIRLRIKYACLRRGEYQTIMMDDNRGIFGFERKLGRERVRAIFNATWKSQPVAPESFLGKHPEHWEPIWDEYRQGTEIQPKSFKIYEYGK